jgi:uncharacterized lipoprotein YbaY
MAFAALALVGCGSVQLDTRPEGNPNRIVTGTVELGDAGPLPPGAEVAVRVVDPVQSNFRAPTAVLGEPSTDTPPVELPPKVLGEQRITDGQGSSIPFRVPYYATDDQLRVGLILEARVSLNHRVRFYNVSSYSLNLENAGDSHQIYVNPVGH